MTLRQTGLTKVTALVNKLILKFEQTSNKVTSWSSTTTDIHYPSAKLVKDNIDELENQKLNKYVIGFSNDTQTTKQTIIYNNDTDDLVKIKTNTPLRAYLIDSSGNNIIDTDEINNIDNISVEFLLNGVIYGQEINKTTGYADMPITWSAGTTRVAQVNIFIDDVFVTSNFCKFTMVNSY